MAKSKKSIATEVRGEVQNIIAEFNQKNFGDERFGYSARFRGKYLYLTWQGMSGGGLVTGISVLTI